MTLLNRRTALVGLAAVPVASAVPAFAANDAAARIKHHTQELDKAMREPSDDLVACVCLFANGKGTARPANSRWLFMGGRVSMKKQRKTQSELERPHRFVKAC
jgi:hypothetical protein